ncbi:LytR C-terminal domain-containing protein [Candidatus Beckwithbacteria bacterium]|nr:LytR C-terminal domain-containing protein [Candidatus Beckwithbacteria bacterium]
MHRLKKRTLRHFHFDFKNKTYWKFILIFLLIFLVCFFVYQTYLALNYSIWDGKRQITLAVEQNNQLAYLKITPELNEAKLWLLPTNAMLETAYGYGEYKTFNLKKLAKQEDLDFGSFLQNSMTQFLGSVTDGYLINLGGKDKQPKSLLLKALLAQAKTKLTAWDLLRLYFFVNNLRFEQVEVLDLSQTKVFSQETLPDQSEVLKTNFDFLDKMVFRDLANPDFLKQDFTWEIYNGTNHSGLANLFKRIVANSGFDVVGVRQANELHDKTMIYLNSRIENPTVVNFFASYFALPITVDDGQTLHADVAVFLGEDFWQKYCSRPTSQ